MLFLYNIDFINVISFSCVSIISFAKFLDKRDEPLIAIETVSNIKNDIYIYSI